MPPRDITADSPRRRPEHFAAAQHRAFVLQRAVAARPRAGRAGAAARDRVRRDAPFATLPTGLQSDLLAALERAEDEQAQATLLDGLARRAVDAAAWRDLLGALRARDFDAALAARALGWLDRPAFGHLAPEARRGALAADLRLVEDAGYRRAIEAILRVPGLADLDAAAQVDLLRYVAGPRPAAGAAPLRAQWLTAAWGPRRAALLAFVQRPAFRAARATLQAEMLQDFLQAPTAEVWILHATALSGHATVVLGSPADPKAVSYGRRWVRTEAGHPRKLTCMPDPTIRHGWRRPAIDAVTRYAGAGYRLGRLAELSLVEGLERLGGLDGDAPVRRGLAAKDLITAAEDAARFLCGQPPRHEVFLAGRPVEADDGEDLDMLQAFLAA